MAHFAKIENGIVTKVMAIPDAHENNFAAFQVGKPLLAGTWIKTSYNGNIRKNFAGVGYTYDELKDAFIPPKPT